MPATKDKVVSATRKATYQLSSMKTEYKRTGVRVARALGAGSVLYYERMRDPANPEESIDLWTYRGKAISREDALDILKERI